MQTSVRDKESGDEEVTELCFSDGSVWIRAGYQTEFTERSCMSAVLLAWTHCLISAVFQTCDIKAEGKKRFLTLKNVQLDQAGEVSYQGLNAVTTAMLTVKGMCRMNLRVLVRCLLRRVTEGTAQCVCCCE